MFLTYTWLAIAVTALVLYLRQVYTKLSRDGVNHLPIVPFFGQLFWVLIKKEHITECLMRTVNAFPDDRVVGHYDLLNPLLIIRDTELIKRITIKDFDHFVDRRQFINKNDPMFGRGLVHLCGDEWKAMRSTITPAFTSSKIRQMLPFMVEVGEEMIKVITKRIKDSGKPYIDVETRDMASRYASDVIASCAFGLNVNSQEKDTEFFANNNNLTNTSFMRIFKIFLHRRLPSLCKTLRMSLTPTDTSNYFTNVVLSTMENREKNNIIRHDVINILMQVKKGQLTHDKDSADIDAAFAAVEESSIGQRQHNYEWSDTDLVAQAVLFLFAGFGTVSITMSYLLYEIALHPDVQERLVKEFREYDDKSDGKFDYKAIQEMAYLDMVVSEGLRLWPVGGVSDRHCVKDYNLGRPNSKATKDVIVRKGENVILPMWAFHRDPKYFPEPLKFDPDRFSPGNKHNIKPFSYLPFGSGPRNCIGSRFALCEIKVMLYQLLREMEVYPCEKTCVPAEFSDDNMFTLSMKGGAWVRLRLRPEKLGL